jgi:hypothetical protein
VKSRTSIHSSTSKHVKLGLQTRKAGVGLFGWECGWCRVKLEVSVGEEVGWQVP